MSDDDKLAVYGIERADGSALLQASTAVIVALIGLPALVVALLKDFFLHPHGVADAFITALAPLPPMLVSMLMWSLIVVQGARAASAQHLEEELKLGDKVGMSATEPIFNIGYGRLMTVIFLGLEYAVLVLSLVAFVVWCVVLSWKAHGWFPAAPAAFLYLVMGAVTALYVAKSRA